MKALLPGPVRDWVSARLLNPLRAAREARAADASLLHPPRPRAELDSDDWPEIAAALVATGVGLLHLRGRRVQAVLDGRFFGLTRRDGWWYAFQNTGQFGRILRFRMEDAPTGADGPSVEVRDLSTFVGGLWSTVHQIDWVDERLWVTDPRDNQIRIYDPAGRLERTLRPLGELAHGRASANYAHLNSVYGTGERVALVAHNYTQKSGRNSELLLLDRRTGALTERVSDIGRSAHNLVVADGHRLVCDSGAGALLDHGNAVFRPGIFTRGLAYDGHHVLVGGSLYGPRAERVGKDGFLYVLSPELEHRGTLRLVERGPVFDLRFVRDDRGLTHGVRPTARRSGGVDTPR